MEEKQVTPQEQSMYDTIAVSARGIIFGEQGFKATLEKLTSGEDIGKSIGHTAAMILRSVEGGIKKQGRQVPPAILIQAADDVLSDLIDIAEAAKLIDKKHESEIAKQALDEILRVLTTVGRQQKAQQQPGAQPAPQQPQSQGGLVQQAMGAAQ